jgi:hypothetical protein
VFRAASNLQNTDRYYKSSFSTIQVSGVGCQEDIEASTKNTACEELSRVDDRRKKADGFLPLGIGLLTPDTIDTVLFIDSIKYTAPFL